MLTKEREEEIKTSVRKYLSPTLAGVICFAIDEKVEGLERLIWMLDGEFEAYEISGEVTVVDVLELLIEKNIIDIKINPRTDFIK